MITQLRMLDEIYQHELNEVCLPQWSLHLMEQAFAIPHQFFYYRAVDFLRYNYNAYFATFEQLEYAFQLLQQDLLRGRVLITHPQISLPAFYWVPPQGDDKGHWELSAHVRPEHRSILQLARDNARTMQGGYWREESPETPSAIVRTVETATGAAKQAANDLMRRSAAINAQWQAETGKATFTDKETGQVLSPDAVKQRWEDEGKDVLPITGADQQQGAQMAKDSPALGVAMVIAQTATSHGRNIIPQPDDLSKDLAKAIQGLRGPKDKQLSEALGKLGGEQAKRRQGMETDPRYVDRYHGPDDMTRDEKGALVEWEFKGNKTDSTSVTKDSKGHRQGSTEKNKRRSEKMARDKAKKVGVPSNRQGGTYTDEEIDLWKEVQEKEGNKRHVSVHTNTETGTVRTYDRDEEGKINRLLDEFEISHFDEIKTRLKDLLK